MQRFYDTLSSTMAGLFEGFVELLPSIVAALVIIIIGVLLARALGRIIAKVLHTIYLDEAAEKSGLQKMCSMIGIKIRVSNALGVLIKWFLYAITLIAAAEVLDLTQVSEFFRDVVLYIPNVIVAVVILVVGVILSNFIFTLVKETATSAKLDSAHFLATLAKWAILIFSFMAALIQLGVVSELIQILFTGLVAMCALAGGIAFGLGGKDKAKDVIDSLTKK